MSHTTLKPAAAPTGAAASGEGPRSASGARRGRQPRAIPYTLLAPAAVVLAVVVGYPLVRLVLISFHDYGLRSLFTGVSPWAGFANYTAVFHSADLVPMLVRTALFCLALAAATLVIGMSCALMMKSLGKRMRSLMVFSLITAWAMPNIAATLLWTWLFQPTYGVVNWLLTQTHLFGDLRQHDWTASAVSGLFMVWLLVVWQSVPFVAVTLYAGVSQVPAEYYEAAELDGAGYFRRFRVVTVPFLRPVLLLVAMMSVIWDFNVFNQIWLLTAGGPHGGTSTLVVWAFTKAFASQSYGQGAAIAVLSTALLTVMMWYYVRRMVHAGEGL